MGEMIVEKKKDIRKTIRCTECPQIAPPPPPPPPSLLLLLLLLLVLLLLLLVLLLLLLLSPDKVVGRVALLGVFGGIFHKCRIQLLELPSIRQDR